MNVGTFQSMYNLNSKQKIFVRKTEYFTENSAILIIQSYKRGLCFVKK